MLFLAVNDLGLFPPCNISRVDREKPALNPLDERVTEQRDYEVVEGAGVDPEIHNTGSAVKRIKSDW